MNQQYDKQEDSNAKEIVEKNLEIIEAMKKLNEMIEHIKIQPRGGKLSNGETLSLNHLTID